MTDKHPDDSPLDAAIDRAVRDMMSVEPRADLRRRVLSELVEKPARAALWPRLAFGSAALALLIVVMFVLTGRRADRAGEQTIVQPQPPASVPGNPRGAAGPSTETAPKSAGRESRGADGWPARTVARSRRPGAEDRRVQAASIDSIDLIAIEPLAPVERLRPIAPIAITRLDAPLAFASEITPITIERIEITPLTPPSPQR
jgi:hypothetical protein